MKPRKFRRAKIVLTLFFVSYVIICQSCATMRMTPEEASQYFEKARLPYKDRTAIIDKHTIHYIETGKPTNPMLFFVHGSPGSWDAYKSYASDSLLIKKFCMIAVDRPGFGYSEFGNAEDLDIQAALIAKLADSLRNGTMITLVGHSLGGPVIVKMATEHPERYKNLVILSGAVDPMAETPERWRPVFMMKPLRYLVPGAFRTSNDELWWLKDGLKEMEPDLGKITSDVVIIHGTKDPLVPYRNADFMLKNFTHARTVRKVSIVGANHFIPWEHFNLIREELLKLE